VAFDGRESVQLLGVSFSALFRSGSVPNSACSTEDCNSNLSWPGRVCPTATCSSPGVSVIQQSVLPLNLSIRQHPAGAVPGGGWPIAACAAPGRVCIQEEPVLI
jgi:hypothetical protein